MNLDSLMTRATVRGFEARTGIESFAHLLCRAWKMDPIRIEWGNIPTACIDAEGNITLGDIGDADIVNRELISKYAAFVLHELLHRRFTLFSARDGRRYVDALLNAIEDARIERACIDEGIAGNARALLTTLLRGMCRDAMGSVKDWADPAQYPFSLAVYLRDYGPSVPVPAALMPVYTEARRRLASCRSTKDSLDLARWVFDQMRQQNQQNQQGQEGQQNQQNQQGQEGQQGKQNQQGQQGQQGESAQDTGEPSDAGKARKPVAEQQSMETEPQCPTGSTGHGGSFSPMSSVGRHTLLAVPRAINGAVPGRLRYEVRRLFENTARDWAETGHRSGRLHGGSLHRLATGRPEVFSRRYETDGIESAAVLCIDLSGSMCACDTPGTSRLEVATQAAWALADALMSAGVDVAIVGFESEVFVLREFGTVSSQQARDILGRVRSMGGTNDYAAVRHSHSMLLRHAAQRKVCFVFTDGDGDRVSTRAQVQAGNALGISTIALGICHDVRGVYGENSVRVNNLQSMGAVALRQIKTAA